MIKMKQNAKISILILMLIFLSNLVFAMGVPTVNTPVDSEIVFTTVTIDWDEVTANATYFVEGYNITLLNSTTESYVYVKTINESIDNATFSYIADLTSNESGYYSFGVEAVTNDSDYSPTGYSGNFTLDHVAPVIADVVINTNLAGYYTTATLTCGGTYTDTPYNSPESGSTFRWFVDDAVVSGQTAATYSGAQTDGTTIICEYTPLDGYNTGSPVNSSSATLTTAEATGCAATKTIIYAAFALIAVSVIVLAGFMIIQLFKGDMSGTEVFMAVVIGAIAIGVIIMVGYFVIDKVGSAVCTA
jgi:hypothetical protein